MINNFTDADLPPIVNFYVEAFQTFKTDGAVPAIEVSFYPYVGINHTIRVRQNKVFVRLAEISRSATLDVQRALAFILVAKLLRKKVPPPANAVYQTFVKSREIQTKAVANRRANGRKIISGAAGEIYDLEQIFARLNRVYFQDSIEKPVLSWSVKRTFRILGHHDAAHDTIIISKSLDDRKVPRYVVEFIVFHEMLHIFHPTIHRNGRRYNHTAAFRRDERKFVECERAESWITANAGKLKRSVTRKS